MAGPKTIDAAIEDANVGTYGPEARFGAVLFIEKEGFAPLIEAAKIAERFDVAIMSTKGMSVTAARILADRMCHKYDIPLLIAHDFDKSGFSIAGTLQRDTRRYEFQYEIETIDIGLSVDDVENMGLASEYQAHTKGDKNMMIANLRENGATDKDIAFLFRDFDRLRSTRRVELNAMTSPQFIEFIESKLEENNVEKVIPDDAALGKLYTAMQRGQRLQALVEKQHVDVKNQKVPKDLREQVIEHLNDNPEQPWDVADAEVLKKQR
jgi:hypothetical protein